MKKIVFDVTTPYQLLIATITSEIFYKNDFTILLINNFLFTDLENLEQRIFNSKLFNQVNIINEKASKESIKLQIDCLKLFDCDIYHFSSYSSIYSCYLFNNVSNKTTLILNEEGIASYDLFINYKKYRDLFPLSKCDFVDLNKLEKIYVLEKNLYISENKNIVESLPINKIENINIFIENLNYIFNYSYSEIKEDSIFFTQNFIDYKVVTKNDIEIFFTNLKQVYGENLILKLHPFDKNTELYKNLGLKILDENNQIPWEVIVYNHILNTQFNKKTLLTIGSTSLCNTYLFFQKNLNTNIKFKILCDLFNTPFNESTKKFYYNLSTKTDFKYSLIKKFNELLE